MSSALLFNKPFNTLCQFTDKEGRATLAHHIPTAQFPGYYPAGRLDFDSEGLVLLTNDGILQNRISDPSHKLPKQYWVQVEGNPSAEQLHQLKCGPVLKDGPTKSCQVTLLDEPDLWERDPPIRVRMHIPTRWLQITLTEGRNRQVRRMTAAVGLPTLRLVRQSIGPWQLDGLGLGEYREISVHLPKSSSPRTALSKPRNSHRKKSKGQKS